MTVFLQSYLDIEKVLRVSPGSFRPKPKVESTVLRLVPASPRRGPADREAFFGFVKTMFSQRRKMLASLLRDLLGMQDATVKRLGEETGIEMKSRPEQLALEEWFGLFAAVRRATETG